MIQAKNVSLTYADGTVALRDVSLNIRPGEFVYIVGPSGSGKTSLLKLLMGIEFPSAGSLYVMDQPIVKREAGRIRKLRRSIGPVFQEFRLIQGRTALENVLMGMRFLNIPNRQMVNSAKEALTKVGLGIRLVMVEKLSFGEAQVAIAGRLQENPHLFLPMNPPVT